MNSAGPWSSSKKQILDLCKSKSAAVVTKTFTIDPLSGNEEPNKYIDKNFSINSVGLTNKGSDYFIDVVSKIQKSKPIIASIAETSIAKIIELAKKINKSNFDALELNLSCPNIIDKEPLAYNTGEVDKLLLKLLEITTIPIGVKLPPFTKRSQIGEISDVLSKYKINHLVLINTYPFASMYVEGKNSIKPNDGVGGLGGSYLKPIALAHVKLFKAQLPNMPIVGVGGIQNSRDMDDFLRAGADAIQLGTILEIKGTQVLNDLSSDF